MRDLLDLILQLGEMLLVLSPFLLLVLWDVKSNLKRDIRYRQFFMPVLALLYCVVAMILLHKAYEWSYDILQKMTDWLRNAAWWMHTNLPSGLQFLTNWLRDLIVKLDAWFAKLNLVFWAFYLANALLMLVYMLIKKLCMPFMKRIFSGENRLFQFLGELFYDYDEEMDAWYVKKNCGQARTFLKTFFIVSTILGLIAVLGSSKLYLNGLLAAPFYPVFSVIIVGEMYFLLDGLMHKELKAQQEEEEETQTESVCDYSGMRKSLRKLFPDRLAAENTFVCEPAMPTKTVETLLQQMEECGDAAQEAYATFLRNKQAAGLELDRDYMLSGRQVLGGESVLFNNPFYWDLIPYIFYPLNRTLLRHKKVLIILGRHGAEKDAEKWVREGLMSVNNVPDMWSVGVMDEDARSLDVGIITRSGVHDLKMHEANREFFDETEFVVILEPSRLVSTAQIGLNSLVRHCRRKEKKLVFCSSDKNCDGLVDALSHILMTSLSEVSATGHPKGTSSYMIWEADNARLQHRMLPNLSRYLGMGTELSFAALKNQVEKTQWCGGEAFPVEDIRWIVRQYYFDLLNYAGLPAQQETIDEKFLVSTDMWGSPASRNQYITVEDESFNMFEVKRDFATRALEQGFINVITSEYLLKDYMTDNDSIFNADPKAIPYITADYARSPRNVALRLCLRMSTGLVSESDVLRDLMLVDRDTRNPMKTLWELICSECGHIGRIQVDKSGHTLLYCDTADGPVTFQSDVIIRKRRFCMDTGDMENMYCITNGRFIQLVLGDLRSVEYIAEDEEGQAQYLGMELRGQVFQRYLPGQMFTFKGKYYEMLRVTSDGRMLLRRAADHIDGRPFYRQERKYYMSNAVDSRSMGHCRDMGNMRITRQYADFRVSTPGYWTMNRYNDFATGRRILINGVPDRQYNNKSILRIDLKPNGNLDADTLQTLVLLMSEVLRTLLAENQDFLAVLTPGQVRTPLTYTLEGENGFQPEPGSIYILEDGQLDMGLLDAVERNLYRIFAIISDYLQWHEEKLTDNAQPEPASQPGDGGNTGGIAGTDEESGIDDGGIDQAESGEALDGEAEDMPAGKKRKKGGIFQKIGEFFKKTFGRKKKKGPAQDPVGSGSIRAGSRTVRMSDTEDGGPTQVGAPGEGNDVLEFEPEQTVEATDVEIFARKPYQDRCYLRYGSEEVSRWLDLSGVAGLLAEMGYSDSFLTQVRKGRDVAKMVERTFTPNKEGTRYCDFCGCELTGAEYDILADGRERCKDCGRTAVKSLDEFTAIHDAVLRNLNMFFGIRINAKVHVQMVNSKKLHKKFGKTFVPTGKSDGRVLGVAIKDGKGYSILIENGAPKVQSTMTMVHEMTHIWQYLNWDAKAIRKNYGKDMELEIYEGMAKWVEIQYAYLAGEVAHGKREEIITRHRDDEYGRGFLKYAEKYPLSIGALSGDATPFDHPQKPL